LSNLPRPGAALDGTAARQSSRSSRQPTGVWPAVAGALAGAEARAAVAAARAARWAALKKRRKESSHRAPGTARPGTAARHSARHKAARHKARLAHGLAHACAVGRLSEARHDIWGIRGASRGVRGRRPTERDSWVTSQPGVSEARSRSPVMSQLACESSYQLYLLYVGCGLMLLSKYRRIERWIVTATHSAV
jgi:hypothetical protein